ncbi:GntR family transcriptional regulator [Kiritimatiellaeota bacterium B1221]|nr:GntR family transcriptional regulator [Kiritimatiellaeota bacterium B1221]
MIDTRSIHVQLLEQCQQDLTTGKWAPGDRFPSERELAGQHGISRATANKVLARLISEGWLEHQRGIGCFVTERPTLFASLQQLESFTDFAHKLKSTPVTEVLSFEKQSTGDPIIRKILNLPAQEPMWFMERRRSLDSLKVIYEQRWLPTSLFPDLTQDMLCGSFYKLCRDKFKLEIGGETLNIRVYTSRHSEMADWKEGAFAFTGTGNSLEEQPVWYQRIFYRGDVFELRSNTLPNQPYPEFGLVFRGNT